MSINPIKGSFRIMLPPPKCRAVVVPGIRTGGCVPVQYVNIDKSKTIQFNYFVVFVDSLEIALVTQARRERERDRDWVDGWNVCEHTLDTTLDMCL